MKKIIFFIKLIGRLFFEIYSAVILKIADIIKRNQALSAIYLLLLVQLVLLMLNRSGQPVSPSQTTITENEVFQTIDPSFINTQVAEVNQYEEIADCQKIKSEEEASHTTSRNVLINCGLILYSQEEILEYDWFMQKAKSLDPNWIGWIR